jgi:hypothetical protein
MNIHQVIKQIEDGFEALNSYFANGNVLIDSPLCTDYVWCYSNQEIKFSDANDERPESIDDFIYSNDVVGKFYEEKEYSVAYVNNGCGDQYWMILKNSNRRVDLE